MPRITEDLVLGARYRYDQSGATLLRLFDVSGLTPGRDTLAQAAGAVDSTSGTRIPRYGDSHPSVPGLYVLDIEAEPASNSRTAALVKVRYGTPEAGPVPNAVRISIHGTGRYKPVSRLPDGSALLVKYTDASGSVLQDRLQVPVLSPNTVLEFVRQELNSPLKRSVQFRRTVNASPWQAGAAKGWLCRAIDGRSLSNLSRYEVRYVFEYDPDGWERLEFYVDRYTGKIPDDVQFSDNNDKGIARLVPYGTMDFGQLGLPNAF